MGSLFGKIFFAFWLTLILLGVAMYVGERSLGDRKLVQTEQWLGAHAETAATLLREEGPNALRRWLYGLRRDEREPVLLLKRDGEPYFSRPLPPHLQRALRTFELEPGARRLRRGHYLVVAPVMTEKEGLFLAGVVDLGRLHRLTPPARIAIALLISGLVSMGLAALLTRPVRRLRSAAQALAEGDLSVRVGAGGRDEIGALGRDFDIMAERLAGMLKSQRRLLRDVSHELRSPLARLRIALELAERSDNKGQALQRVAKEADELEQLVSSLLSLSRLESGQSVLERCPVNLEELLQTIANDADFEAQAHGRRVTLQVMQRATLEGDPVLLRAAVENVVRNAVRHTAEGSTVEIHLERLDGEALVRVCDQGEGVPETALQTMFEPFTRVAEARDRDSGGFGLGLAITGQVVTAHGGKIAVHNRSEGGLSIELLIPLPEKGA